MKLYSQIFRKARSTGKSKEHHPALPKHQGKQLKDRSPQQIVGHCGSCIIAPITKGSCSNPPFHRGTTLRKWAQRTTPPLLCHWIDESLLTYTAASPPRTHGVRNSGAHVTGRIDLEQISNATDNNSQVIAITTLSDLATQTVSNSLVLTVTALSIEIISPAVQLALWTKLSTRSSRSTHTHTARLLTAY
ncbi:hypothetical protein AVEN_174492-1 [Araneus ventricosus]|uniref:Uncharacterized protein n=1 Tax=Araneus ventricosus TaxID=182803 RepID=A0A4Y2UNP3_ARAVE|nr:hypothetical protein AVEN_231766-1 [Araneus ventricosus]GBO13296.1 hypothetical protein AVEN_174492-1 [Araneus ventricosus]